MRHAKKRLQLNRFTSWHDATVKSLAKNLLINQTIKTTLARAKAARSLAEKLISLAKKNTLAAKRQAFKVLGEHKIVAKLFNEIGPNFAKRESGFTRIIHLGNRRGDNAQMVILELTEIKKKEIKKHKKEKEAKPESAVKEKPVAKDETAAQESKPQVKTAEQEHPEKEKKPQKKFLGGLRQIFKKERDSL